MCGRDPNSHDADCWVQLTLNAWDELIDGPKSAPVPAPRLEWRVTGDEIYENEYWRIEGEGTRGHLKWLLQAWDGNEGVVMQTTDTLDAAKSLAEKLNTLLSPPVGPQE